MHRMLSLLLVVALLSGCKGAEGPMGPAGPAGPPGAPGPGSRLMVTVTIGAGGSAVTSVPIPAGVNPLSLPSLSCYVATSPTSTTWIPVLDGFSTTSPWCAVSVSGSSLNLSMHASPPGWTAAWVIVY